MGDLTTGLATSLPPGARPMVAVLDALPGRRAELVDLVRELVPLVRAEPGCLQFLPFAAQDDPDRLYLYEVYANQAAFQQHLRTEHVARFMAGAAVAAVDGSMAALHQLDEIPVPTSPSEATA